MADAGERVLVYEDGSAEAFLPDHGLVVKLSPSGATFVAEPFGAGLRSAAGGQFQSAGAAPVKQRTDLATRAYVDAVRKALWTRNTYSASAPYLPVRLLPDTVLRTCSEFDRSIATVRWPALSDILEEELGRPLVVGAAAESAISSLSVSGNCRRWCFCERRSDFPPFGVNPALYAARGGPRSLLCCHRCRAVALMSLDRKCLVVLSPGGALLQVIWPCEILCPPDISKQERAASTSPGKQATARCAWVRQVYSVETCPNSWRHPLALVQGCLRSQSRRSRSAEKQPRTPGAATATGLPYLDPRKLAASDSANALFLQRNSAEDPLPISVLWTPRAVFRRVKRYGPGAPADFEAIATPTGVVVRSMEDMNYVVVHRPPTAADGHDSLVEIGMYRVAGSPSNVRCSDFSESIPIGDLLGELSTLRLNASLCETRAAAVGKTRGPSAAPPPFQAEIKARTHVPLVGDFAAYRDGRLRVIFEDCCVLDLFPAFNRHPPDPLSTGGSAGGWQWRLVRRDGTVAVTRFENPVGMERYVAFALQFLRWANSTRENRDEAARAVLALEEKLAKLKLRNQYFLFVAR